MDPFSDYPIIEPVFPFITLDTSYTCKIYKEKYRVT